MCNLAARPVFAVQQSFFSNAEFSTVCNAVCSSECGTECSNEKSVEFSTELCAACIADCSNIPGCHAGRSPVED